MTRRTGRPTKYSRAIHEAICRNLEAGMSRTTAAELAGINRLTLERWRDDNVAFCNDTQEAMAKAKARATVTITKAIRDGDVGAAFRYLALQERSEWAERASVDMNLSGTIRHAHKDMSAFTDEEIDRIAEIAERWKADLPV